LNLFKALKGSIFTLVALGFMLVGVAVQAGVEVTNVSAHTPIIEGRPGVAYFTVKNSGAAADRLLGISSPAIGRVEMHQSKMDGGMMSMEPVESIDIPAGSQTVFKPGSYHAMLFDINKTALAKGTVPLVFTFEKAGKITVEGKLTAMGSEKHHHH
jgi:copper(I)-binding protein